MYVTYETNQYYIDDDSFTVQRHTEPPKLFPTTIPKSKDAFMPSKLVRISDMKVVQGSTVKDEGYCALSYSWSWSGENNIVDKASGKSVRVDKGKHQIIFPPKNVDISLNSGDHREGPVSPSGETKYVVFEGIIQQLCKDFNVKYIWYDQMCIDQENKEEKHHEIQRMHHIYGNAHCTIVHVPELRTETWSHNTGTYRSVRMIGLMYSDWIQRMWTLEEAIMSPNLLFVGQDVYMWWSTVVEWTSLGSLVHKPSKLNAATVLYYAHSRKCTKEHDRVYALANLYPSIMQQITVNYHQPIMDLLIKFYGFLAEQDLSVLCFGKDAGDYLDIQQNITGLQPPRDQQDKDDHPIPIRKYDLPSWTGFHGEHDACCPTPPYTFWKTSFKNYSIHGRFLKLACSCFWSNNNTPPPSSPGKNLNNTRNNKDGSFSSFAPITLKDIPPVSSDITITDKGLSGRLLLCIQVQLTECHETREIGLGTYNPLTEFKDEAALNLISKKLELLSVFLPINKSRLLWRNRDDKSHHMSALFSLSLTEEEHIDFSAHYAILSGVAFLASDSEKHNKIKMYPVVKKDKDGDQFTAIGNCTTNDANYFFSGYTPSSKEHTFVIH